MAGVSVPIFPTGIPRLTGASMDREKTDTADVSDYGPDSTPYKLSCACPKDRPDWIDAGCVFHGVQSFIGAWEETTDEVFDYRRKKICEGNNRWGR